MLVCAWGKTCEQLGRTHRCLRVQAGQLSYDQKNSGNSKEFGSMLAAVFC